MLFPCLRRLIKGRKRGIDTIQYPNNKSLDNNH